MGLESEKTLRRRKILRWRQLCPSTKRLAALLGLLVVFASLEVGSRIYWAIRGVPVPGAERIWTTFFPEAKGIDLAHRPARRDDPAYDVLLLGGSVLHPAFGSIAERLALHLESALARPVRIVNFSYPGRTSRDSALQYEHLAESRFDLVVFYHGINDAFLNNCPAYCFRKDYSHCARYAQLKALGRHPELPFLTLGYTAEYLWFQLLDRAMLNGRPRRDWHDYGGNIKTRASFERNLLRVVELAEERGDPLLLMTFAVHLPADYSAEKFADKQLDYGRHLSPIDLWGRPPHVLAAVERHNQIVREVAREHPAVALVDQESDLPDGRWIFDDVCHLTDQGCDRFARNIVARVSTPLEAIASRPGNPRRAD